MDISLDWGVVYALQRAIANGAEICIDIKTSRSRVKPYNKHVAKVSGIILGDTVGNKQEILVYADTNALNTMYTSMFNTLFHLYGSRYNCLGLNERVVNTLVPFKRTKTESIYKSNEYPFCKVYYDNNHVYKGWVYVKTDLPAPTKEMFNIMGAIPQTEENKYISTEYITSLLRCFGFSKVEVYRTTSAFDLRLMLKV